jgi:iron complex outermembrane receptor protein
MQVRATDQLSAFTNVSIVSDDFFDNEELDTENAALSLALNAPSFKMKGGFNYRLQNGLSFGATGNYVEGFRVETGPYVGNVDSYFLLDLSAGYDFPTVPGLRLEVTAKNVLDNEHREFVGAPAIGLLVLGRMTYTL